MRALDRLISVFSPQAALRRVSARALLDQYRDYAAAGSGRRNRGWRGRGTSANVEAALALSILRNRAREFVRDSWAGQRILDVLVSHCVGTGIQVVPNTGSDRADNKFRLAWEEWEEASDAEGVMNFGTMQALAVRSMVEGGESVLRHIDLKTNGSSSALPIRLLGLEGDQIDGSYRGEATRLGVKLGEYGQRKGLYLFKHHPGDENLPLTNAREASFVPWGDLIHLYRPQRFGQIRGVTWYAPILLTGKEMQDLTEAAIVKERTQASFAGFMKRQPGGINPLNTKEDDQGRKITRIEPGMIADIGEADIVFSQPSGQSSFGEAYIAGMQAMAAGAGITYDQLTGDLTRANYSSLRAGKIEFRRLVEQVQWHILAPRLIRPVARRFIQRGMLAGILPVRRDGYRFDLVMPANEPIDPKKDLEADILAVRAGRLSPQEFISAWGRDWRKVVADTAAFLAEIDKKNVTFDIDARRPVNGQATQRVEVEG